MAEVTDYTYKAFLSYSHKDTRYAKKLHRAIETFKIDKDLIGTKGPYGEIKKSLRPIFRDREDFSAGHSLTEQTIEALKASPFLIVLCSPSSAKSKYVNEEIRLFKQMGRGQDIIPVIVDGEPGHETRECFPPALKYEVTPEGDITNTPAEVLAADIRESGDGWGLAVAKVVARLLGRGTDDVYRRAERERRRMLRLRNRIIAALSIFGIIAAVSAIVAYQELQRSQALLSKTLDTMSTSTTMVNRVAKRSHSYGIPQKDIIKYLKQVAGLFEGIEKLGVTSDELRINQAWLQIYTARTYQELGNKKSHLNNAKHAEKIFRAQKELNKNNPIYMHSYFAIVNEVGDALRDQKKFEEALKYYQKSLKIIIQMRNVDPQNDRWNNDLFLTYNNLGRAYKGKEDYSEALKLFKKVLEFRKTTISKKNSNNSKRRRALAVSYENVANTLVELKRREEAEKHYSKGLNIMKDLVSKNPNNYQFWRHLAISHYTIADNGFNPIENWQAAINILTEIKAKNKLAPREKHLLPTAQKNLAKAKEE